MLERVETWKYVAFFPRRDLMHYVSSFHKMKVMQAYIYNTFVTASRTSVNFSFSRDVQNDALFTAGLNKGRPRWDIRHPFQHLCQLLTKQQMWPFILRSSPAVSQDRAYHSLKVDKQMREAWKVPEFYFWHRPVVQSVWELLGDPFRRNEMHVQREIFGILQDSWFPEQWLWRIIIWIQP
jgi:hypothetical protein